MSWTLWWQIAILIALVAFCSAFVKSVDSGKAPK